MAKATGDQRRGSATCEIHLRNGANGRTLRRLGGLTRVGSDEGVKAAVGAFCAFGVGAVCYMQAACLRVITMLGIDINASFRLDGAIVMRCILRARGFRSCDMWVL